MFPRLFRDDDAAFVEVECEGCGEVFAIDLGTGNNLDPYVGMYPECPSCGLIDSEEI
jgi:hypothetical protein